LVTPFASRLGVALPALAASMAGGPGTPCALAIVAGLAGTTLCAPGKATDW
jgi:hypothetical protein